MSQCGVLKGTQLLGFRGKRKLQNIGVLNWFVTNCPTQPSMTPVLTRPQAPGEGESLVALWITDLFICFFFSIYLNGRSTSHKQRNEFHTPILKCGPKTNTCSSFNGVHQHTCSPVPFASVSFVCNKVSWPSNHRGAVWGSCFLAAVPCQLWPCCCVIISIGFNWGRNWSSTNELFKNKTHFCIKIACSNKCFVIPGFILNHYFIFKCYH